MTNKGENIPFTAKDYIGRKSKIINLIEGDEVVYDINNCSIEYKAINVSKQCPHN